MYPTNSAEWIALLAALTPLTTWAVSGLISGLNRRAEGKRADWRRIQDLMEILTKGQDHGAWRQQLAVRELAEFKKHRADILAIAKRARDHFGPLQSAKDLVAEIDDLIARLS